ncbi:MAG: hypothetical protein ACT4N9_03970 [Paracoccaceae bacterium]
MDDRIYAGLAIAITLAMGADAVLNGGEGMLYLARKLMNLVGAMTFWRN